LAVSMALHGRQHLAPPRHVLHPISWTQQPTGNASQNVCLTKNCILTAARVLESMDTSVDPCHDFYRFACGGWVDSNPLPDGKAAWGTLTKLTSDNQIILRSVLESPEEVRSEAEAKAKVFYQSCLDKNGTIQKLAAEPLLKLMKKIGWREWGEATNASYDHVSDVINSKIVMSSGALFSWGVAEDDKNSSNNIIQFEQGGLTLSSRELYLNASEHNVARAYVDYMTKVGELLGASSAKAREVAEAVLRVETMLANATEPPERRRDVMKLYDKMTLAELTDIAPFMDWAAFINRAFEPVGRKLSSDTQVVVYARDFLKSVSNMVNELKATRQGNDALHHYLTWQYVENYINLLSDDFRDAAKILAEAQEGITGKQETWRQCVEATDESLGPALGAMYVRRAFGDRAKADVEVMLARIRKTFRGSFKEVSWMDDTTKRAAMDKADSMPGKIGYPDYILDPNELDKKFEDLTLSPDDFFGNNLRVTELHTKETLLRLFKPVNKTRWDMTPPTVNAYYSPTRNDIVFLAGILQPPLFSSRNPNSLNYGAVGVVMGHEMAHAFDDIGRDYDKHGNLAPWWQPDTTRRFEQQTQCMVDQYSSYAMDGEAINGKLSLGENIADNSGLKVSYRAYRRLVAQTGEEPPLPGLGYSHDQLFFIGFGQLWCSTMTKERVHLEIKKDTHAPAEFRVLGSLSNFPEFSKLFNCKVGSRMNPKDKCQVW